MPDLAAERGPVIEYLLKEVSYSTCDDKFFGELEKEMLIPNNLNIYARLSGAETLDSYKLKAEFSEDVALGYLKAPETNVVKDGKRVLTYNVHDLVNYEDYWWLPLKGETEFVLPLNLLPPFPRLNPIDLNIACNPQIAIGLDTHVTTTIGIRAEEHVDNILLTVNTPYREQGMHVSITEFSGDNMHEPRMSLSVPKKEYPFPRISLKPGESKEYIVKTRIQADLEGMTKLKCQHNLLTTKLVVLSESAPHEPPCSITLLDENGTAVPVKRTERSTLLSGTAQIMYTPFHINRPSKTTEPEKQQLVETVATT